MNFLGFEIKRTDKSSDVQINKTDGLPQSQGDAVIDTLPKSRERLTSVNIDDLIGRFAPYAGSNFYTLYKNISEIQFALNFIVERAKMPQFVVKKYSSDAIIWDNKDFNRLLEKVNKNTTFNNYIGDSILMRLLTGNSYCFADTNMTARRYKYTDNFKVLPAHLVKPKFTKGDYFTKKVESYILNVGGRNYTLFPDNILHVKDLIDYEKDGVGVSRLQSLKYPISNLIAVYEARNVIYTKRGALGAIVSDMKDDAGTIALKASEKEDLNKTFNDTYGFEYNKSQYIISDIPVRYIQMGANIRDLEPFKETLIDAFQIASAFQIDGDLIPKERGATFENKKIAELKTLSNFIKGRENLETLLGSQNAVFNKNGLGYNPGMKSNVKKLSSFFVLSKRTILSSPCSSVNITTDIVTYTWSGIYCFSIIIYNIK